MAYNKRQFKDLIERVLKANKLYSEAAVNLLMGTAAVESNFGTYLRQIKGPALSAFQIEPMTYHWLSEKYWKQFPLCKSVESLEWDLSLAILVARLKYLSIPEPLPPADDIPALARYWKRYYNTPKGKGTEADFVSAYVKYCK
jgi:hypothetical protein